MQWFGLLGAPLAWTVQLVLGFGVTEARCGVGGSRWGVECRHLGDHVDGRGRCGRDRRRALRDALYYATREVAYDGPAPIGRRHFFVAASSLGNVLFLVIILLSGIAAVEHVACRQS